MMLRDKKTFYIALIFVLLLQGILIYKGIETTPFFNYGMFSEITIKKDKKYYVKIDTIELNWNRNYCFNKNVLLYNIENYELAIAGDTQINQVLHNRVIKLHLKNWEKDASFKISNKLSTKEYQEWFLRYLQKEFTLVKSIEIGYYNIDNNATNIGKNILFVYHD